MVKGNKALQDICGSENVLDDPEALAAFAEDQSFAEPKEPACIARPGSAEQVQGIVRWACDTGTPLIPVSSGAPHFRGDTVPTTENAVIVDLSGMDRIIRIDRRNRVAMIEPGVTFAQLQEALGREGMRIAMPLLPRRTKSVLASCLEREPTTLPAYHWDYPDPLLCPEIIFGTGELMRGGDAAGVGTIEEQWEAGGAQKCPMGPFQLDYFRWVSGAQGTIGIVTWSSVKCELLPKRDKTFIIPAQRLEDLADFAYSILRRRLGYEFLFLNDLDLAAVLAEGADDVDGLRESLPPWSLIVSLGGLDRHPEERIAYQEKQLADLASQYDVRLKTGLPGISGRRLLESLRNPSPEPYWKLRPKGGCHDLFFLTTLDKVPAFLEVMREQAEAAGYPPGGMGIYVQPLVQGAGCHCEFNLYCDPSNTKEAERVRKLLDSAINVLMERGAYFSRPYGSWADSVYGRNEIHTNYLRKLKDITDPKNIMNPGKLCFARR
jgi:FAD/FMN-containing dehydrogenase